MSLFGQSKEEKEYQLIFERQHPKIKAKQVIYKLIQDSYAGTTQFKNGEYLRRGLLEYKQEYEKRLADSTYENFIQPANDTLCGLLYSQPIQRKFNSEYEKIADRITKDTGIEEFMMNVVAPNSLMISGGVLVDSPKIPNEYQGKQLSKKQQIDLGLYPYAVYYPATMIRDFAEDGSWVLLDDTYCENSNPYQPQKKIECRTLWTASEIIKYKKYGDQWKDVSKEVYPNPINEIPFIWCNWRDINNDKITESPFEDIAELNKSIYNIDSIITENAFQSSFAQLIYQGDTETINKIISAEVPGSLSVIPISSDAKIAPSYIQRPLANIAILIELEQTRINRIMGKIGLGNTSDKTINMGWQSRKIEFEKCEAILRGWAEGMENVEEQIFYFYSKWQNPQWVFGGEYEIEYPDKFQSDSVLEKMEALKEVLLLPLDDLNRMKVQAELLKLAGIEQETVKTETEFNAKTMAQKTGNTQPAGDE